MKQRVITALIFGIIFIGALLLMNTVIFPVFVAVLSVMAVYEIEKAVRLSNKLIISASLVISAAIPFVTHFGIKINTAAFMCIYVVMMLIFMLVLYEKTKFEQAVIAIFSSVCVPFSFSLMIIFRDAHKHFSGFTPKDGVYLLILAFCASWATDIFAYFVGSKLGKHKLCPKISPKKSVEGAIGGVVGAALVNVLILFIFRKCVFEQASLISYPAVAVLSVVLSVVSMFGDLAASTIKRNFGIKDFGKLLPGHGGIMDRFDSALFVMPVLYAAVSLMNN